MPKGFGVGLRVATIPVAGIEPLSPDQAPEGGTAPGGGGSSVGGGASGGIGGGIGLIGLLLLTLGIGVPVLVSAPQDQQAQVQQSGADVTNRVTLGAFEAE